MIRSRRPLATRSVEHYAGIAFVAFLCFVLVTGGSGLRYPLLAAIAQGWAAVLLALAIAPLSPTRLSRPARALLWVLVATVILGVIQLVPLPAAVWRALSGRDVAALVLEAAGIGRIWHPLSLAPDDTVGAVLALLPPLATYVVALGLTEARRMLLLRIIVGAAVFGAVLGVVQFALDGLSALIPYDTAHAGFGIGLFVNRNHQAAFLLAAMLVATTPGLFTKREASSRQARDEPVWVGIVATLLAFGVLATTSRTGFFLLPIVGAATIALAAPMRRRKLLIGAAVLLVTGVALYQTPIVQQLLDRFATAAEDERYNYWTNTLDLIGRTFPWGGGFGSFTTLYPTVEPLQQVKPQYVNHAHNDYLEALLDGGLFAALLVLAAIGALASGATERLRGRMSRDSRIAVLAPLLALCVLLAFSVDDYPLRMTSLAVLAALFAATVLQPARPQRDKRARGARDGPATAVATFAGLATLAAALAAGVSAALTLGGEPALAARIAPWDASAWSELANERYLANDRPAAERAARRAMALAPLDPVALRVVALAALSTDQVARGERLMGIGATLGWRESVTQIWLANRAAESGAFDASVQRMDALLRQRKLGEIILPQLRIVAANPQGRGVVARELADRPGWRQAFVNALVQGRPADLREIMPMLAAMRAAGAPATLTETTLIRAMLAYRQDYPGAAQVWRASGGGPLPGDADFAETSGVMPPSAGPFAWRTLGLSGVTVAVGPAEGAGDGKAATIITAGMTTGPVFAQTLALVPRSYRLDTVARRDDGARPDAIGWTLRCLVGAAAGDNVALDWTAMGGGWWRGGGRFAIPVGCTGQDLEATLTTPTGRSLRIAVDAVSLEPLAVRTSAAIPAR